MTLPDLWPPRQPDLEPADFGWFEPCAIELLSEFVTPDTKCIVELGSWLGKSTRWFLDTAPSAQVIAIDHWKGSVEHRRFGGGFLDLLWPRFLYNCWDYRDRLIPVKADTQEGMEAAYGEGIKPDLVYVDANHATKAVIQDITTAMWLWPDAQITGDDWIWKPGAHFPVRQAVKHVATKRGLTIHVVGNTWALLR